MQKAIRLVTRFLAKCQKDKINAYSAQIAFFIILSIIPFLMVFSSMLQYTSITEDMVFEIIERVMPQYVAPFLVTLVKEIYTRSMGIISVTAIIAIWSAAKGIQYMADGLNAVHELKETRNWFVLRFWAVIYDPEKGELSYAEAVRSGAQVVFNTTPAGMYPNVGVCSLDVAAMPGLEAVVDVVYNPNKTELILRAEDAGVPVAVGGLEMLVAQAVYAAEYFLGRKFEDAPGEVRRITAALRRETLNIALVGMPSCGKSTLGRLLAKQLGRPLVDLDEEIVKADGRSIPDIFAAEGEEGFRAKEAAQIARFGKEKGLVLSCGGGAVKRAENIRALRQNGVVLFIDRPVEALAVGGNRPLSSSAEALRTMEAQRRPLYLAAADAVISNTGALAETLAAAQEALDEIFDS